MLAALNHPHIAAIHGLEEWGGRQALVLEFVEGPTLAERIAFDMPPEGTCEGECAADVAAFILHEFVLP
ncbi:MAG: hypothetical protein HC927_13635 [Deltaproteobacteria bacterium]|nr:hypothetical protein [Deltaproteobacteria bacterium]